MFINISLFNIKYTENVALIMSEQRIHTKRRELDKRFINILKISIFFYNFFPYFFI